MPSKSEIKKNPKVKSKKTTSKKSALPAQPLKAKSVVKKIAKSNGKEAVASEKKKLTSKTGRRSLKSRIVVTKRNIPTIEQITARAHQLWLDEGCPEGRAQIHWQQAESELIEF